MDFKQLKAFLAVADLGNVTKAAELLHLVQPAVSRQIRLLEEDVGRPLFVRERYGMVLTDAGHALVDYARRAMLELDRARAEIASTGEEVGGLVTIGLLPSTVEVLASPLVAAVKARFAAVRVRIAMGYAGTLMRWLESGEVDAALLYGPEHAAGLEVRPLVREPLWVVGSQASGLRQERPTPLRALVGQPLILPSPSHGIRSLVDHACAIHEVALTISAETNALSVQRSLVLGGHGLTILPPIAVAEDLRTGQLRGSPLAEPAIDRSIVLALSSQRTAGLHVQHTLQLLEQCVAQAVASGAWPQAQAPGRA
ncbi:LysR family transcriptional regulator [Pseudorhodoferax sp.]|uniref:LysR family transcriptional regulator n=1 Tax=Pseudorhodoferax sp. TaxID=1993553 RepID=UPI002DD68124|nr:LysR family transcriptional regulator [Pseudorhodoferax sp.]